VFLFLHLQPQPFGHDGFGTFQVYAQCTIPVELRKSTDTWRYSKQDRVVQELRQNVQPQQDTGMGIDKGLGVGHLAMLLEDTRHDLVDGIDDVEQFIVGQVFQGKFMLAGITRIHLVQDCMAIAWNDLFGIESGVHGFAFPIKHGLEFLHRFEDFLIGLTVEWSSQSIQTNTLGQVEIEQGQFNQVCCMHRGVTTFVIDMNIQIQMHKFIKQRVIEPQHTAKVE